MNNFNNVLYKNLLNYRIIKSPLEVIKPNEHRMTYAEYRHVLKTLSSELSTFLNEFDEALDFDMNLMIINRATGYNYYIRRDYNIRSVLIDKYQKTHHEITQAFLEGRIFCSINNNV